MKRGDEDNTSSAEGTVIEGGGVRIRTGSSLAKLLIYVIPVLTILLAAIFFGALMGIVCISASGVSICQPQEQGGTFEGAGFSDSVGVFSRIRNEHREFDIFEVDGVLWPGERGYPSGVSNRVAFLRVSFGDDGPNPILVDPNNWIASCD